MSATQPPVAGDETAAVLGELERVRSYVAWKCGGLDSLGLDTTLGPSAITLDQIMTQWQESVDHSRTVVAEALAAGGLDQLGRHVAPNGQSPNLRRMLSDLIEEYARHVGHADLIRESVDGLTGEDPE